MTAWLRPGDPVSPLQYVQPGQIALAPDPRALSTILGSCVAVCLWDRVCRVGGMNHFVLPACPPGGRPSLRFGGEAMPELLRGLAHLGAVRTYLEAWVFGGGHVIDGFPSTAAHLGARNVEVAREFLDGEGIPVVGGDVGGRRGRRVIFDTADGRALVRML